MPSTNCLPFRSTRVHPRFQWGSCCLIFICLCSALLVCTFVLFRLVIYCLIFIDLQLLMTPFGIFKLFSRKLSLLHVFFYVKQCDSANRGNSLTNLQSVLVMSPLSEVLLCAWETVSYFYTPELIISIIFIPHNL